MGRGTTSGSERRQTITRAISLAPALDAAIERARGTVPRSTWIGEVLRERLRVGRPDEVRRVLTEALEALDAGRVAMAAGLAEDAAVLLRGATE